MIYLRNKTKLEQWLEDPTTGIRRKIEPDGMARVSAAIADLALLAEPTKWAKVIAIPLAPPEEPSA